MTDNINPFDNESPWGGRIPVRFAHRHSTLIQGDLLLFEASQAHVVYRQELVGPKDYSPYTYVLGANSIDFGAHTVPVVITDDGVLHVAYAESAQQFSPMYTEDEQ